ncbi:hypothetical protein U14_01945 [Candidatus Moduliflexus flocculans]|jgi:hypothetical protein|uniref:DUF4160 domain-containing protein n=1 Tax=Candidatus Moduliflexus flocculans TaxID=1499966 RepID=A0A0S6VT65_9BACT|nr:hypothetical protein U14_01945 [Candidatus Moduliflexus flocculans]
MPTVQQIPGPYRLYFYSFDCTEPPHVHVQRERMVCKFWLDPLMLCDNHGFTPHELRKIRHLIERYNDHIMEAWYEHCGETPDYD